MFQLNIPNSEKTSIAIQICFNSELFLQFCFLFNQTLIRRQEKSKMLKPRLAFAKLSRPRLNETINFFSHFLRPRPIMTVQKLMRFRLHRESQYLLTWQLVAKVSVAGSLRLVSLCSSIVALF